MKTGKSLTELAGEIERQAAAKKDLIAPTADLHVAPGPDKSIELTVKDHGHFVLRNTALTQIGERVGIPVKYLRKMQEEAPQLLADNVNHWFQEQPERRMIRTLYGDARAFLSDKYQRIDNFDVAKVVLPALRDTPGLKVRSTEITESRLYIKASTELVRGEIKSRRVGDIVEAGVMISNSEIGMGSVSVTPFAYLLACLNGMTREGGRRWNHVGKRAAEQESPYVMLTDETKQADDRAQLLVIRDTLTSALNPDIFQKWLSKIQGTTEQRLTGSVEKAVEVLSNSFDLTKGEQDGVLRHLIEGGDLSRYGLLNAVTRTAEDAESYDRATELESLGARVVDLPVSEWKVIAEAA